MEDKNTAPPVNTPEVKPPELTPPVETTGQGANGVTPPPEATPPAEPEAPAPAKRFELTKVEHVTLENIQLRRELLQQQLRALGDQQNAWGQMVGEAHGVDIRQYNINLGTGFCDLIEVGEPNPPAGGDA